MQDRFKFRCFWEDEKQMYYCDDYCMPKLSKGEENIAHIMQCTGLKDINGKLIYEKDIVKIKCVSPWGKELEAVGYVYYDRCAYWINFKNHSSELYCEDATYEVLGNVWENPELLENKV